MRRLASFLLVSGLRVFSWIVATPPPVVSRTWIAGVTWLFFRLHSGYRRVIVRNLSQAFPLLTATERRRIIWQMCLSLGRLVVDMCRTHELTPSWMDSHVELPNPEAFRELAARNKKGILLASAHLGSFEVLGLALAHYGHPMSVVVRRFSVPEVDAWWNARRQMRGSEVINREGGVRSIVRALQQRRTVGILMDQNVTKNHAVFVPFFGRPAATSGAVALLALRSGSPIMVATIENHPDDRYRMVWEECFYEDLVSDASRTHDEKVQELTARITSIIEARIRNRPGEWFWMHRRWRTTIDETAPSLYAQ